MNILVDTSVWSLALRRKAESLAINETVLVAELTELIREGRARIIGAVRQELLTGLKTTDQYEKLRATLRSFPDEFIDTPDYELAAKVSNDCRAKGVATSVVDMLICSVALSRNFSIFTADPDFQTYKRILPITLHTLRKPS